MENFINNKVRRQVLVALHSAGISYEQATELADLLMSAGFKPNRQQVQHLHLLIDRGTDDICSDAYERGWNECYDRYFDD